MSVRSHPTFYSFKTDIQQSWKEENQLRKMGEKKINGEQEIIEQTGGEPGQKPAGLLHTIFKYSDSKDMLLMLLGSLGCFADGSSTPLIMLVVSTIMNNYAAHSSLTLNEINKVCSQCFIARYICNLL